MEAKARADLVRACREESKQDRRRQASGFAVLDRMGRAQGVVDRANAHNRRVTQANNERNRQVYGRIGERIDRGIDRAADAYNRTPWAPGSDAHARRTAQAAVRRQREHGYDITPEFQRRSRQVGAAERSAALRSQATGVGISNRWRGSTRQVGLENGTRLTEAQRTAAILRDRAARRRRLDTTSSNPDDYAPRPRSRERRGRVVYHDRRGDTENARGGRDKR